MRKSPLTHAKIIDAVDRLDGLSARVAVVQAALPKMGPTTYRLATDGAHEVLQQVMDGLDEVADLINSPSTSVTNNDPMLAAIAAYEAGNAAYNALPSSYTEEHEDQAVQETYAPPLELLTSGTITVTTVEGAVAALRLLQKEAGLHLDSGLTQPLARAVADFLEAQS